ncbi:MAG: hypothetical protein SFV54_07385 [Bryobacteraceae bacterium]|nr:hypothetical protein [Bryobacteraceae bacterium]
MKGAGSPAWALDGTFQSTESPSGQIFQIVPMFGGIEYSHPISVIVQHAPNLGLLVVGLVNGSAAELSSPNLLSNIATPADAFAQAEFILGTSFSVREASRLTLADGSWLDCHSLSFHELHWWLVGVDSTGTRRSLVLSARSGDLVVEYEGLVARHTPRHEKHIPTNPLAPFSSPASFEWNSLAGQGPISCVAPTPSGACSEPFFSEAQLSKTVIPETVDYWFNRSKICNSSIDWPFTPVYPPLPQYTERCKVRPVSAGTGTNTLQVTIAESGATCTGSPCWFRSRLVLPTGTVSRSLVGHEWGHEVLRSLGQFNHTTDGLAPNNAVTEFLSDFFGISNENHWQAGSGFINPNWVIRDANGQRFGGWSQGTGRCSSWADIRNTLGLATRAAFDTHVSRPFFGVNPVTKADASFRNMERGVLSAIALVPPLPFLTDWVATTVATRGLCDNRLVLQAATACQNELGDALVTGLTSSGAATQTVTGSGYRVVPCAP